MRLETLASAGILTIGLFGPPLAILSLQPGNSLPSASSVTVTEAPTEQSTVEAAPSTDSLYDDLVLPSLQHPGEPREFYFTRAAYTGYGFRNFRSWSVDFPKADRQSWGTA